MNNFKPLLSLILLIAIATSCTFAQKRVFSNKTYSIQSFSSVESDVVGNVIFTQSEVVSARAEGDKELIDNLRIIEENDVLKIDNLSSVNNKGKKELTIYISSPTIKEINMEGVGNFKMDGAINIGNLKIDFDGVGNFEAMELKSKNIKANYEGVGNLKLGGTTDYLEIDSGGVGSVDTQKMKAKNLVVRADGVGSVKCFASESIDLKNSGVGSITYYGNPKVRNLKNAGIGKIITGK